MSSTTPAAAQARARLAGGFGSQPAMKAKPVKKISCQPKGLKNQTRSDQGSAGRPGKPVCAAAHIASTAAAARPGCTRFSATTAGIIASATRYIGRMSK